MTTAIVSNAKTIQSKLFNNRDQIKKYLPVGLDVDRFMQIAWGLVRQNPKLLECSPESVVSGICAGAQLGLSFDRVLGQAFLVPYWNSKARCSEAQFQVGFRGLCQLAYRSERISAIWAEIIHKDDTFEDVRGTEPKLHHVVNLKVDRENPADWLGVYAVGKMKDGSTVFRVLSRSDVYDRRNKSKTWKRDQEKKAKAEAEKTQFEATSLWSTFEKDMWLKTAIRSLAKMLPQSADERDAIRAAIEDEYRDAGVDLPTPELPAGAIEVAPEATAALPQAATIWQPSWGADGLLCLGSVPSAITEQIKFKDLATWLPKRKVWLATPECADDLVLLFQDCGYTLVIPESPKTEEPKVHTSIGF